MDWYQVATLAVAVLALAVVIAINASSIRSLVASFQAEAAADRRALQASMNTFRAEMQRLAERQVRIEEAGD